MTRRLVATALVAAALSSFAAPASADCVSAYRYQLYSNPYDPLPQGGGGGEPHSPMPGQPREWATYSANATTAFAKCLAP